MDSVHTVTGRLVRKNAVVSNLQEKSSQTDEISKCVRITNSTNFQQSVFNYIASVLLLRLFLLNSML